jgi:tetratricopeptide (TPR) repeat protein
MMDRADAHGGDLRKLLEKHGIPAIFIELMHSGGRGVKWDAAYFRDKSLELRIKKDFERALGYAEIGIKIEPSSNSYLVRGCVLEDLKRFDEAIPMFEQALEISPSNTNARHGLARAYSEKYPKKALEYLRETIENYPGDPVLHAQRAVVLTKAKRFAAATEDWDAAATLDPLNADYPYEKAELLLADKKTPQAVTLYRRAVGLNEKHIPARRRLTELLASKNPASAFEFGQPVAAENPDDFDFGILYADILRRVGEAGEASKNLLHLIELNENDHRCWVGLARIHRRFEPEKALEYIDRALALCPREAVYHKERAGILEAAGRPDEAAEAYRVSANLNKKDSEPLGALGRLLTNSSPKEALEFFEQALKLDPEKPLYYTGKAIILQTMPGRGDEALDALDTACKHDPGNAALRQSTAVWLERINNRASALRHFSEAVNIDPNMHESFCGIARQFWDTRPHKALSAINTAISKSPSDASYFYWKARILSRLSGDVYAISHIEQDAKNWNREMRDEADCLIKGEGDLMRLALSYADLAVDHALKNNTYLCFRAQLLAEVGRDVAARKQYEELLRVNADNHEALYGLGYLLAGLEKEDQDIKALELYDRAITLEPSAAHYHAAKAKLLARNPARYNEAVERYRTAIPLDTLAWRPVLEFAELLEEHQDIYGAIENYRRCLLIHRDCLPATASMGRLLYHEKPIPALVYIEHAIKLDKDNWVHRAYRGCTLYKLNRHDEGAFELAHAKTLAGEGGAQANFTFAGILLPDMPEEALMYCQIAVNEDPVNCEYLTLLGDIHSAAGDENPALEAYKRAVEADGNRKHHRAMHRYSQILYKRRDPKCLQIIEWAIAAASGRADYHLLKADILEHLKTDLPGALNAVEAAAALESERVDIRERLVDLLKKNRKLLRLPAEMAKLAKARRKLSEAFAAAEAVEEITFEEEE